VELSAHPLEANIKIALLICFSNRGNLLDNEEHLVFAADYLITCEIDGRGFDASGKEFTTKYTKFENCEFRIWKFETSFLRAFRGLSSL
jgi:hypothetical protein